MSNGNRWVPKSDMATVIAGFAIMSGIIFAALGMPSSELIVGAGVGFLFGKQVVTKA